MTNEKESLTNKEIGRILYIMNSKFKLTGLLTVLALTAVMASACTSTTDGGSGANGSSSETVKKDERKYIKSDGSILVGKAGAIPVSQNVDDYAILDVYFDPMCPGCGLYERETGEYLDKVMEDEKFLVRYHPLMFLDSEVNNKYSSRVSSYIFGVAEHAPKLIGDFIAAIFDEANQPSEANPVTVTDAQLDELFKSIGGTDAEAKEINKDLEVNMKFVFESTMDAMKSTKLSKKSPTGSIYTPFVIPNEPGKEGKSALGLQDESVLEETKAAVEKILK